MRLIILCATALALSACASTPAQIATTAQIASTAQAGLYAAATLARETDAAGRKLDVIRIPGVGLYHNALGEVAPASHMNFIIANGVVVVPIYGTATEADALQALQAVFPDRAVVGVSSRGLLGCGDAGGGSFHCITQQEPV